MIPHTGSRIATGASPGVRWLVLALVAGCQGSGAMVHFPRTTRITVGQYEAAPRRAVAVERVLCDGASDTLCRFSRLPAIALASGGHVLVAPFGGKLTELDSAGRAVRVFGTTSGEGSYRIVAGVTLDSARNIWLFDVAGGRWLGFSAAGAFLSAQPVARLPGVADFVARDGALFLQVIPPGKSVGAPVISSFLRVAAGAKERVVARVPAFARQTSASEFLPVPRLFEAKPVFDAAPDGSLAYSNSASYDLMWFAPGGAPELQVEGQGIEPPLVTPQEIAAETASLRRPSPGQPGTVWSVQAARRHPAITALRYLRDSIVMVRCSPEAGRDSVRWDLWDASAVLHGYVLLGVADHVVDGTLDHLLVVSWSRDTPGRIAWLRISRS